MQLRILKTKRPVSILLLIMATFFCRPGPVWGAPIVYADKDTYHYGEMIKVNFTNAPGQDGDWICIVPAGSQDTEAGDYQYIPEGLGQGSLTFDPPSPGKYEARVYYNYSRKGYVVSGRYAFSVVSRPEGKAAVVQPMKRKVNHSKDERRTYSFGATVTDSKSQTMGKKGIVLMSLDPDGPATRSGLRKSDIITHIGVKPVDGTATFVRLLNTSTGNITLTRYRPSDNTRKTVRVVLQRYSGPFEKREGGQQPPVKAGIAVSAVRVKPAVVSPRGAFDIEVNCTVTDATARGRDVPFSLTYAIKSGERVLLTKTAELTIREGKPATSGRRGLRAGSQPGRYIIEVSAKYKGVVSTQRVPFEIR